MSRYDDPTMPLLAYPRPNNGCELHRSHQPVNQTCEWHHLVPVAWQLILSPMLPATFVPPSPGQDPEGRGLLWDNRGIWVCPTGHRNAHHWIVQMMRYVRDHPTSDLPLALALAHRAAIGASAEAKQAIIGVGRFQTFGSLLALTDRGQYGQV